MDPSIIFVYMQITICVYGIAVVGEKKQTSLT